MRKIAFVCGVLCFLYVGLGLVAGLLPIDVWSYIIDLFNERDAHTYYKIVPTGSADYQIPFVTLLGVALIVLSKIKFRNAKGGQA